MVTRKNLLYEVQYYKKLYFYKTLVISIIFFKCGNEHKQYFKKKNQLKQKFLVWFKIYNYFKSKEKKNSNLYSILKK